LFPWTLLKTGPQPLERIVFRWNQLWRRDFGTRPSKDAKNALLMRSSGFAKELAQKHPPE
jgi:hypothetical protein